jgi:predicted amino acid racemase
MKTDVFECYAEILEITEKPTVPVGEMAASVSGERTQINEEDYGKTAFRALIDIGLLDISPEYLIPNDPGLKVVNASSDLLVVDLGDVRENYQVGDLISFKLKYMGALTLLSSDYVDKVVV